MLCAVELLSLKNLPCLTTKKEHELLPITKNLKLIKKITKLKQYATKSAPLCLIKLNAVAKIWILYGS